MKISIGKLRRIINEASNVDERFSANHIRYGNAPLEFVKLARRRDDFIKEWFVQSGWMRRIQDSAPTNDSDVTRKDLEKLVEMSQSATEQDVAFSKFVDDEKNISRLFIDFLSKNGYEESLEEYYRVDDKTLSLLFYLKDVINRPRPYQLAQHYRIPLYPLIRTDAMTASYPSGHALVGFVMSKYYSRKYPHLSDSLKSLGEKVAKSREIVAIHYPSDTEVSRLISEIIFDNDLIE